MTSQKKCATCEGCAGLRTHPRPMCVNPNSLYFRTARETYHARCALYAVTAGLHPK